VITCNSCGELVQVGLANCQHCGMPLYSANQGGTDLQKGVRGQSELPTWLESLRVNERPNSPASEQSYFPMADLFDEGALPSWMRPENAEMMEKGNSGQYPAWRPASMSAPHTDEGIIPPEGIPARSLIDEQSLPSWVQGNQQNIQATTGAMPVTPDSQGNFSAASLIQPDDLPDWMKSLSQSPQPSVSQNNVWGGEQPRTSQVRINSYTPDPANVNSNPLPQRFSAQDLVDPQAMTHLMSGQPGQQVGYPLGAAPQGEHSGLPASSLLDMNSLPAWLREEDQTQRQPGQMQAYASSQSGQIPAGNNGLTGASLIDANALPGWLPSYEAQQQAGIQSMGNVRPLSTNGTPPRVESVRVPSRPRGEIASHEQSEVAANVFSSVLGVASSAPYFPSAGSGSQWNAPSQNVAAPSQGFQGGQPQPPAGTQWNAPSQPSGFAGVPPSQGYNPAGNRVGQQGAYPSGGYAGYMSPGGSPMGAQSGMTQQPPASGPGMPGVPSMTGHQSYTNASGSKPAKRGFIETIRSWFS
jgi:hypothetical protein